MLAMKNQSTVITVCLLLIFALSVLSEQAADAERLTESDLDSTMQPGCDLCWDPSPSDRTQDRLPTFKRHRPRRPPDSRPQRFPKGRYKLVPKQKHGRLSTLRTKLRRQARLAGMQQIVVLDGDTIRVGSDRVRLRGLDAPELSEPEGQAAKQRLEELLRSGPVRVITRGRDVYDRLVADVFVNGQNVTEILKSEGFAKPQS
jgi:endonuclease YncB( thermonuclease family)